MYHLIKLHYQWTELTWPFILIFYYDTANFVSDMVEVFRMNLKHLLLTNTPICTQQFILE